MKPHGSYARALAGCVCRACALVACSPEDLAARNHDIRQRVYRGESLTAIGKAFGISRQRVLQVAAAEPGLLEARLVAVADALAALDPAKVTATSSADLARELGVSKRLAWMALGADPTRMAPLREALRANRRAAKEVGRRARVSRKANLGRVRRKRAIEVVARLARTFGRPPRLLEVARALGVHQNSLAALFSGRQTPNACYRTASARLYRLANVPQPPPGKWGHLPKEEAA